METTQNIGYPPTEQQLKAVYGVKEHKTIAIYAKAGTGKTSTLVLIAQSYLRSSILCLAFSKSVELDNKDKFPKKNTVLKTTHALARGHVAKHYNLKNLRGNYKPAEISKFYGISIEEAKTSLFILDHFMNSNLIIIDVKDSESHTANRMFEDMKEEVLDSTHSFYLKMFHLMLVSGKIKLQYDVIMIDEYQDTNEVTQEIFSCIRAKEKYM